MNALNVWRAVLHSILASLVPLLGAEQAAAFCTDEASFCVNNPAACINLGRPLCHKEITERGLSFLRGPLLDRTVHLNLHMDDDHECTLWSHADGCDFHTMGHNVNEIYSSDVDSNFFFAPCPADSTHSDTWGVVGLLDPADPRPTDAAAVFGYALHPIQDVYSHSNWVEITNGMAERPLIEPTLDLWGTQPWTPLDVPPELLALHGVDAVVFAEESGFDPIHWTVSDIRTQPYFLPRIDTGTETYLGVISGSTHGSVLQEEECALNMRPTHTELNKDSTSMSVAYHGPGPEDHYAAAALAIRQTAHEWCRILYITERVFGFDGVSVAMGFLVRTDAPERGSVHIGAVDVGSPHPDGTACAATPPGPVELTVAVDEIHVLHDTDANDPGELNFVLALYTQDLTRSKRTEVNSLAVDDGETVGHDAAPGPVTLCLTDEQARAAIATVQGWDDDTGPLGKLNPDGDQALRGVSTAVSIAAPGIHVVASPDMEVTFDVEQTTTDADGDGLSTCDEAALGTNPADADSDDDGLADGAEVAGGTDPLDPDTDGDAAHDGADNCPTTANPGQENNDGDGFGDVCDPDDDNDGVPDTVDNCPTVANPVQQDYEQDGVGDACDLDDDGDGVPDANDAFPHSNLDPTVTIAGCQSGVANLGFPDGSNLNDLIGHCASTVRNHSGFVSCVAHLANDWAKHGLIAGAQHGAITSCASGARIP